MSCKRYERNQEAILLKVAYLKRDRGYPPPEEATDIGTPLQQWENQMRFEMSREEWYHYAP